MLVINSSSIGTNSKYFRPHYDETIVHVDLNNASINELNQFYLNRSHHAKVVSNLSSMKVAFQLYDFIFAAPSNTEEDSSLINAVSDAKNVYFGLAFEMDRAGKTETDTPHFSPAKQYLEKTKWNVDTKKEAPFFFTGNDPLITFTQLASVSRGLGFLNIQPDRDGVFRRMPLLVKVWQFVLPQFAVSSYL